MSREERTEMHATHNEQNLTLSVSWRSPAKLLELGKAKGVTQETGDHKNRFKIFICT